MVLKFNGGYDSLILDTVRGIGTFDVNGNVKKNGSVVDNLSHKVVWTLNLQTDKALKEFVNALVRNRGIYIDIAGVNYRNEKFYSELMKHLY